MVKVLFICKHNRFRSRVAAAYAEKINKNPKNRFRSAGIFPDYSPLDKWEVHYSKKQGVDIRGKPRKLSNEMLKWQDMIVIVADDVRKSQIKNYKKYRIIVWKVTDTYLGDKKGIKAIIREIKKRVDVFNKKLKKRDARKS